MSIRILLDPRHNLNPEICEQCSTCIHWNAGLSAVYAKIGNRTVQVAQCLCEDDGAPYGEVTGPFGSAVFTHAESHCGAFELHPETAAEMHSTLATYAEINNQLTHEAWM